MDFTVYVVGEANSFYSVLNGVAMVFSQQGMLNGAFLAGGLITLISGIVFLLGKQTDGGLPGVMGPVSGFLGFFALVWTVTITSSVTIVDIYTGTTVKVDNIPIIVSAPASAFTTASYKIFQETSTAYQDVNGSMLPVTQNGFVAPLKLLYSLQNGWVDVDTYIAQNLQGLIQGCVGASTSFSAQAWRSSTDMMSYLVDNVAPGVATYYSKGYPQGKLMSCMSMAAQLQTDMQDGISASNAALSDSITLNSKMKNPNDVKGGFTADDVLNAYQAAMPTTWQAMQTSDVFMTTALSSALANDTYNCLKTSGDNIAYVQCVTQMNEAMQRHRDDAAGNAQFFTHIVFPFMTFLQLMFFGFSPLVAVYGALKGGGAFGMFIKYLLFGIWTSSWLPFAAIIQSYVMYDFSDLMAALHARGLTLANYDAVYDLIANRIGVASDMLAATPLVSLAILTGSTYSLTQVASRWSGKDYVDEKKFAGGISNQGMAAKAPDFTGNRMAGMQNSGVTYRKFSMSSALTNSEQSAASKMDSANLSYMNKSSSTISDMQKIAHSTSNTHQDAAKLSSQYSERQQKAIDFAQSWGHDNKLSKEALAKVTQSFGVSGGFKLFGTGVTSDTKLSVGFGVNQTMAADFAKKYNEKFADQKDWSRGFDKSAADIYARTDSKESAHMKSKAKEIAAAAQLSETASKSYSTAVAANRSLSSASEFTQAQLGGYLENSPRARQIISGLRSDSRFNTPAFNKLVDMEKSRLGEGLRNRDDVAFFSVLDANRNYAETSEIFGALSGSNNGPDKFNAGEHSGVGSHADKLADDKNVRLATAHAQGDLLGPAGHASSAPAHAPTHSAPQKYRPVSRTGTAGESDIPPLMPMMKGAHSVLNQIHTGKNDVQPYAERANVVPNAVDKVKSFVLPENKK